jgi:hypothetical protein
MNRNVEGDEGQGAAGGWYYPLAGQAFGRLLQIDRHPRSRLKAPQPRFRVEARGFPRGQDVLPDIFVALTSLWSVVSTTP